MRSAWQAVSLCAGTAHGHFTSPQCGKHCTAFSLVDTNSSVCTAESVTRPGSVFDSAEKCTAGKALLRVIMHTRNLQNKSKSASLILQLSSVKGAFNQGTQRE